jgi:hypothetical protein
VLENPANLAGVNEKTELRVKTASTKITESEFAELESFASRRGQSLSEWIRQTLLGEVRSQRDRATTFHVFTELVGIQLLLLNTLGPLIRGERMTAEHLDAVLRQVQSSKTRKAQELLNKRLNTGEQSA